MCECERMYFPRLASETLGAMAAGCWLRRLLNIPRNHRQWPCLLITRLLVTTTHPVLRPNIFISKHFRLSVLSGFPAPPLLRAEELPGP